MIKDICPILIVDMYYEYEYVINLISFYADIYIYVIFIMQSPLCYIVSSVRWKMLNRCNLITCLANY